MRSKFKNKRILIGERLVLVFLGIFLTFLLLEISLRLFGFLFVQIQERANKHFVKSGGVVTILCVGESNTALGGDHSYPRQLERILNNSGLNIRFKVINKGISGGNSQSVVDQLQDNLKTYKPDIVLAMMGASDKDVLINRSSKGGVKERNVITKESFWNNFKVYKLFKFILSRIHEEDTKNNEKKYYHEQEENLKKAIEVNPSNSGYLKLAYFYRMQGNYGEAEKLFRKVLESEPTWHTQMMIGIIYRDLGMNNQIEAEFKKALMMEPTAQRVYVELARFYLDQGRSEDVKHLFQQQVKFDKMRNLGHMNLALWYMGEKDYEKAEEAILEGIKINKNDRIYALFGQNLMYQSRFDDARLMYEESLEMHISGKAYFGLGLVYKKENNTLEAEKMFLKAIKVGKVNWDFEAEDIDYMGEGYESALIELRDLYEENNKELELEKLAVKIENFATFSNFQELRERVINNNAKFVAVQYPMRDLESLKNMVGFHENIFFVDNKSSFKEAVLKDGYNAFFIDRHGGDFGHCTKKGNEVLAKNIADVIIKEVYGKGSL